MIINEIPNIEGNILLPKNDHCQPFKIPFYVISPFANLESLHMLCSVQLLLNLYFGPKML